ncbi:MAG: hypothetical protein GY711_22975, partial [bacterium]|nr:hypothetical protein [bacterium]
MTATEPSLLRGGGTVTGVVAGLQAIPRGMRILLETPGIKRFLVPPLFLTLVGFALAFYEIYGALDRLANAAVEGSGAGEAEAAGSWIEHAAAWILHSEVFLWLAGSAKWLLFLLSSYMVAVYTFSLFYEAIAGPFLDEIHGRLEKVWFGENPRDAIERPTGLEPRLCTQYSAIAALPAGVALVFAWVLTGWSAFFAFVLAPLSFVILGLVHREYGRWLRWIVRTEARTLWVSVKAAGWAALVLLLFLWVKLIPAVGPLIYFALVGFTTSITLLDIPFS